MDMMDGAFACTQPNRRLLLKQLIGLPAQVALLTEEDERRAISDCATQAEQQGINGAFGLYRLNQQDPFAIPILV